MSEEEAWRFAAACGRCGVFAYAVPNEDGTWRVLMVA